MPSLSEVKRRGYLAQRAVCGGATITLVAGCGEYTALFECATRIASVLGERLLQDIGDGILEVIPCYKIPIVDLHSALQKLSTRFSVALVEYTCDKHGGQFVLLWRIAPTAAAPKPTPSKNLDDY